jgi:flagellar FliJ protein
MTRAFSLAGLLRVREIQERAAAQRLSRAVIDARHTEARDRSLRAHLAGAGSEAVDVRSLAALAAARVAGRTLLTDLTVLSDLQEQAVDQARTEHAEARRAMRGLDRLAQAHAVQVRAAELHAEQSELDEIGSRNRAEDKS